MVDLLTLKNYILPSQCMYSAYGILVHAHMLYMPIPPSPHGVPHSQYTECVFPS